jgi:uncharacterized membrane protein
MARIEKSVTINADTNQIDAYAINAPTWPQWVAGIESVHPDGVFPEKGGELKVKYKSAGMTFDITMTTREIVHGDHVIFDMEGMINGYQHWQYAPDGKGIKVTCVFDYSMPGGGLGAIADKLIVERMNTSNIENTLANLKRVVETK